MTGTSMRLRRHQLGFLLTWAAMAHSPFQSVGTILQSVVHRHGLSPKLLEHQLLQRWQDIAGAQIAAHSRPDQIRFRKLTLLVESSVWLHQLLFLKPSLIEKINARAGSSIVTDIILRVGEVGESAKVLGQDMAATTLLSRPVSPQAPDTIADAEAHARAIKDPDLRARLAAMMTSIVPSGTATRPPVSAHSRGHRRPSGDDSSATGEPFRTGPRKSTRL
jgi:hypothetical protein